MSEWSRRAFETVITETPKSRAISLSRTAIEEFTTPGCEQEVCPRRGGEGDAHKAKKIESNVRAGAARHAVPIRDYCSESALVVTGGDDVRS